MQVTGREVTNYSPKTASVAIKLHGILAYDGSGNLTNASATSTLLAGISMIATASTDADYAKNTVIPFTAIDPNAEYEIDVSTGTATTAMVGNAYQLADAGGLDVTAQTHAVATITRVISTTKVAVKFNGNFIYKNAS